MNTHTLTKSAVNFNLVVALPSADVSPAEPMHASSQDYGFDIDQEELGEALLSPLPANLTLKTYYEFSAKAMESDPILLY